MKKKIAKLQLTMRYCIHLKPEKTFFVSWLNLRQFRTRSLGQDSWFYSKLKSGTRVQVILS